MISKRLIAPYVEEMDRRAKLAAERLAWRASTGCPCPFCADARAAAERKRYPRAQDVNGEQLRRVRGERPRAIARTYFARIERMARAGLL